jgi:hypothetical protein
MVRKTLLIQNYDIVDAAGFDLYWQNVRIEAIVYREEGSREEKIERDARN